MKREDIFKLLDALEIAKSCKVSDQWVSLPCPLAPWTHGKGKDQSPSFGISIRPDGPSGFNCLSCHEHGNLVGLVNRLAGLRGEDCSELAEAVAVREFADGFPSWETPPEGGRGLPEPWNEEQFDDIFPPAGKVTCACQYVSRRGISITSLNYYDCRWDGHERRILFKVKQDGELYGVAGRSVDESSKPKVKIYGHLPKALFLLGEEKTKDGPERPLVVTEGLMGLCELHTLGLFRYADAVALQGSVLSPEQAGRLSFLGKRVVLLLDRDKAGFEGSHKALGLLKAIGATATAPCWPEDCLDILQLVPGELEEIVMDSWRI